MPTSHATTPACLTIPPLPFRNPLSACALRQGEGGPGAARNGGLPRRFDVGRGGEPKSNRHPVGGAPLGPDRRACGVASGPFGLQADVRRPLVTPRVT